MASLITATIALSAGFMVYLLIPIAAGTRDVRTQLSVGEFYYKMMARGLKQFAYLRRVLSGYDLLPIAVDAEKKQLKLTLDSKIARGSDEYPFTDPDNRIKRLYNKPVALAYEQVPAAIDAELTEQGQRVGEKRDEEGLWSGDLDEPDDDVTVDPWVRMPTGHYLVDPIDAFEIVPNDVDPENVKTAVQLTKQRFSKYGSRVGWSEAIGTVLGFLGGVGGVMGMKYINETLLDGGGGGGGGLSGPIIDVPVGSVAPLLDVVVMVV